MSDVGERMLLELRRIREALEDSQPLGFGKKVGPTYVFVRHHDVGGETCFWYSRDKQQGQNVSILERDLTGYLIGVWRFDRGDDATGEAVAKLNVHIKADKDYVVQTGFSTNFAKTLLNGLLQLEPGALEDPLTLVAEDNAGSRARPMVFCRVESRGMRMTPVLSRDVDPETLYDAQELGYSRGGFSSKIHFTVDALGNPLCLLLSAGQAHKAPHAHALPWGKPSVRF